MRIKHKAELMRLLPECIEALENSLDSAFEALDRASGNFADQTQERIDRLEEIKEYAEELNRTLEDADAT